MLQNNTGILALTMTNANNPSAVQILTGTNTYTRTTTINSGTLGVRDGGTAGSIAATSGVTINGGNLVFSRSSAVSFAPAGGISGTAGTLTQAGPGALTLPGPNTFSGNVVVTGGTLLLQSGSLGRGLGDRQR